MPVRSSTFASAAGVLAGGVASAFLRWRTSAIVICVANWKREMLNWCSVRTQEVKRRQVVLWLWSDFSLGVFSASSLALLRCGDL